MTSRDEIEAAVQRLEKAAKAQGYAPSCTLRLERARAALVALALPEGGEGAEIARLKEDRYMGGYRDGLGNRDWWMRKCESLEAEIVRLRAALSRHTCQHVECSDPRTHAGCHAKMVLAGKDIANAE